MGVALAAGASPRVDDIGGVIFIDAEPPLLPPADPAGADAPVLPGPFVPPVGCFTPCPLCGLGEAGTGHLMLFYSAARLAWT